MTRFALCVAAFTLAAAGVLAQAPNGGGPGPVLGIVEIPKMFSVDSQTGTRKPGTLTVYTRPDSNGRALPTLSSPDTIDESEYGYEEPGALVYGRQRGYYLIRTARGTGWLSPDDAGSFHSLETLVTDGLSYLTGAWDGFVSASPGSANSANRTRVPRRSANGADSVEVTANRRVAGRLWLQVEVMGNRHCTEPAPAIVKARGWVPAHDASGAPTVWFHSRGC